MKIYDISMTFNSQILVYKNNEKKRPLFQTKQNGYVTETDLFLNLHTGTHIDAPLHMIENGDAIGSYDLKRFFSAAVVLDFSDEPKKITAEALKKKQIPKDSFVLLKTKNSFQNHFDFDFIYLDESGAAYLKDIPVNGVGIDSLGIERNQSGHPTHKILLNNNIIILEGLRLADVKAGQYTLVAFPIKLNDSEAALVRAVLIVN